MCVADGGDCGSGGNGDCSGSGGYKGTAIMVEELDLVNEV